MARALLVSLACAIQPLFAAPRWISVSTSHFEMYTTNNERQAERALQTFEQVRYFFLRNSRRQQAPEGRIRIIAFSSENEFKPYRMNSGNFAFYTQSRNRDYIVMQDIEPDHLQAAAHEYTHLIVRHAKLDLPPWLDEGLADLYSSLEPKGEQALVGRPLPQHIMTLQSRPWMNFDTLFAADHDSPYYNQPDKMQIFYAQSWELTHMLALSPAYSPRFSDFLIAMNGSDASTSAVFQKVYGKSVGEVAKDAENYIRRATVLAAVYNVTLKKSDLDAEVAPLSDFQIGLALSDLLTTRPQTIDEAHRRLLVLEQQNTQSSDVEESLGYLAWQQNNLAEARKHFALAVDRGSRNGRMYYDYANLSQMANASSETVIDLMKKAVELRPEDNDSRILLAQLDLEARLYGQALSALAPIHTIEPTQAFSFYTVNAFCHANLRDLSGARAFTQKAASFAKTPEQQEQIAQITEFLDSSERFANSQTSASSDAQQLTVSTGKPAPITNAEPVTGPATDVHVPVRSVLRAHSGLPEVHGITKAFQCGQHTFRLHVQVGQREMVFAMDDPKEIIVHNVTDLQWSCGPLKPQEVTVIYKASSSNSKVDGIVSELVF